MSNATVWVITLCVLVVILLMVIVAMGYIIAWQQKQMRPLDPVEVKTLVDAYYEQVE